MNLIINTDKLDINSQEPIKAMPLFVEIFMGKYKGLIGYTFDAFFPIVVFDDINQTEMIFTTPSGIRFISQEKYEQKVKERIKDG